MPRFSRAGESVEEWQLDINDCDCGAYCDCDIDSDDEFDPESIDEFTMEYIDNVYVAEGGEMSWPGLQPPDENYTIAEEQEICDRMVRDGKITEGQYLQWSKHLKERHDGNIKWGFDDMVDEFIWIIKEGCW